MEFYNPDEKDFTKNGHAFYPTKCMLEMNLNGVWQLEVECSEMIKPNSVLKVPTPYGTQLYRVPNNAIELSVGKAGVNCLALPIFLDAKNEVFIFDQRAVNQTGQGALDVIFKGTKYSGESDITKPNSAYWIRKNGIEAFIGDDENSFINRWGGEVIYDNYHVIVNDHIGVDNGMRVEAGFNMTALKQTEDTSELCTVIVPESYNGYTLPDNQMVESPRVDLYPMKYIRVMKFDYIRLKADVTEEDTTGLIVCETMDDLYQALIDECQKQWGKVDVPKITYDVDIVDLARYPEYKDFQKLVKLNLGDSVTVKNKKYDVDQNARVIQLNYNCITQQIEGLKIGDFVPNFYDKVSNTQKVVNQVIDTKTNSVMADKVKGILNAMNTQFKIQNNSAEKLDCRAFYFEDLDQLSELFGAMSLGTQGIQIADKRTPTNDGWIWGTAINAKGMNADFIITGVIVDRLGNNFINLDTGHAELNDATFRGDINTKSNIHIGRNIYMDRVDEKDAYSDIKFSEQGSPSIGINYFTDGNGHSNEIHISADETVQGSAELEMKKWNNGTNFAKMKAGQTEIGVNANTGIQLKGDSLTINGKRGYTGTLKVSSELYTTNGLVTGGK